MRRMITGKQVEKLDYISSQFIDPLSLSWPIIPLSEDEYKNGFDEESGMYEGTITYGNIDTEDYISIHIVCDAWGDSAEEVTQHWKEEGITVEGDCYIDETMHTSYPNYEFDNDEINAILNEGELPCPNFSFHLYPEHSFTTKDIKTENISATKGSIGTLYSTSFTANDATVKSGLKVNSSSNSYLGYQILIGPVNARFKVLVNNQIENNVPGRTVIRRVDNKFTFSSVHIPQSELKIAFKTTNANGSPLTLIFHSNDDAHILGSMTYTTTETQHSGVITINATNYSSYYCDFIIEIISECAIQFVNYQQ